MNASWLAALINNVALPELTEWLRAKHASGQPLTDADVLQKLQTDTQLGITTGEQWLATHPASGG